MGVPTATVTAYYGNNFDINNIPANPTVLASASQTVTVGVINCLPFSGKAAASIVIKAFSHLKETSYFKIHFDTDNFDWYAAVNGYEYTSIDTVRVDLVIDAWLTCGGTTGITDVSGLTRRHSCLDDTFGKYTHEDPLIIPSESLKLSDIEKVYTGTNFVSKDGYIIVESTVDLWAMGDPTGQLEATVYENSSYGLEVTVPQVQPIEARYSPQVFIHDIFSTNNYEIEVPCVAYFDGSSDRIKRGITRCRSLGVENGILAQYVIPKAFIDTITYDTTDTGRITQIVGKSELSTNSGNTDLDFEYAQVNNKRVLYGENNRYVIASIGTGNKLECAPEEICKDDQGNILTQPPIYVMVDPRSKGCPYFRFVWMFNNNLNFEVNSIKGLEWQSAPINYTEGSGAWARRELFNATQELETAKYESLKDIGYGTAAAAGIGEIGSAGALTRGMNLLFERGLNIPFTDVHIPGFNEQYNDPMFYASRALEKGQYILNNSVVAPEINFPRSEGLRDIVGNGVYLYRYMYTANDLARIDKILNMYGYADVKPLELTDFTDMKYYNYVEADATIVTSVQVTRKIREMCQNQISAGVRVWKINPNFALYAQSNREVTP